ncbi:Ribonuclease H2 subunit A [Chytridiales sp. JEL 0842]|nr:Ribonuclease H2 subunit A [Chytridiales sp. JEL 0842]
MASDEELEAAQQQRIEESGEADSIESAEVADPIEYSPPEIDSEEEEQPTTTTTSKPENTPDTLILPILDSYPTASTWSHYSINSAPADSPLFTEDVMLGVDEAGRGPVLGPMVYGIAFAPASKKDETKAVGVDDSKKLTEEQRDNLFMSLAVDSKEWMGWAVTCLSPRFISEGMLRTTKYNLNEQAYNTTINLIKETLKKGFKVTEIYVDTVGKEKPYQAVLEKHFPGISITVTTKADSKFPIVSAASIFAKVTRDTVVKNWRFEEGPTVTEGISRAFGSGYPADPNTVKWLRSNLNRIFGFPNIIRFSWSTTVKRLDKSTVPVRWEDDEGPGLKNGNITNYFQFKTTRPTTSSKKVVETPPDSESDPEAEDGEESSTVEATNNSNTPSDSEELAETGSKRKRATEPEKANKRLTRSNTKKADLVVEEDEGEDENDQALFERQMMLAKPLKRGEVLKVDSGRDALVFRAMGLRHTDRQPSSQQITLMKYLEFESLEEINSSLSCIDTGDSRIFGRIEAYSCKSTTDDKKLQQHLKSKYDDDSLLTIPISHSTSPDRHHHNHFRGGSSAPRMSPVSPYGPMTQTSVKTFTFLLATLNAAFPDYDFSDIKPEYFIKVPSLALVINNVSATLLNGLGGPDSTHQAVSTKLWEVIDEVVQLKECDLYSFQPDPEIEPDAEEGNFFMAPVQPEESVEMIGEGLVDDEDTPMGSDMALSYEQYTMQSMEMEA